MLYGKEVHWEEWSWELWDQPEELKWSLLMEMVGLLLVIQIFCL